MSRVDFIMALLGARNFRGHGVLFGIQNLFCDQETRPGGYKTFFMLNWVEHEILNAHKYKKYQEIQYFSGS